MWETWMGFLPPVFPLDWLLQAFGGVKSGWKISLYLKREKYCTSVSCLRITGVAKHSVLILSLWICPWSFSRPLTQLCRLRMFRSSIATLWLRRHIRINNFPYRLITSLSRESMMQDSLQLCVASTTHCIQSLKKLGSLAGGKDHKLSRLSSAPSI